MIKRALFMEMTALTVLVWGLLTLATGTISLSYDFDDNSVKTTFYALSGKPLRLQFDLPSSGKSAFSFGWTVTLRNGTNFDTNADTPFSKFLTVTSQSHSAVLEMTAFDASLFAGSQFVVLSIFRNGSGVSSGASPVVKLLEGYQPNFTIAEDRNYSTGNITLTARLSAGLPLPNMTVNGTVLLPVEGSRYDYVRVVNIEQVQNTVYNFVATNEVGNHSLTYNLLTLGLGGNDTVSCRSASLNSSTLTCSYEAFPRASAVLTCPNITKKSFQTSPQPTTIRKIDGSGLFEVTGTFTTDTPNANCSTNHTCVLQVNNFITSTNYTNIPVALTCTTPSPSVANPSSVSLSKAPTTSTTSMPTTNNTTTPSDFPVAIVVAVVCACGGVIILLIILLPINKSCRRWQQKKCCGCCFRCYDDCGCGDDSEDQTDGKDMPLKDNKVHASEVEEIEPYGLTRGAAPATTKQTNKKPPPIEDEIEPYIITRGAVAAPQTLTSYEPPKAGAPSGDAVYAQPDKSKSKKGKGKQSEPPKDVYAVLDKSKSQSKKGKAEPPKDVYAQVDKNKKNKSDLTYADLDVGEQRPKSGTLQSVGSGEGGVQYTVPQFKT
eukprot:m.171496 g.171496  ORF g.171496 m.171496 type:complete len:603 (+) comp39055_c0_seq34:3-1811(+)